MGYIFISYAHKDSNKPYGEFSFDLFTNQLQEDGFDLWIDSEALRIGEEWDSKIKEGIRNCEVFFLIVTENAASSDYTRNKEVVEAQRSKKPVVPIIVEKSALPKFAGVDATQGVDFTGDYASAYQKISTQYQHLKTTAYKSVTSLLDDGTLTVEEAGKHVRRTLTFPNYNALGMLIKRSPYRMTSYLVAPPAAKFERQEQLQIFLQFTGATNEPTFNQYLQYIQANPDKQLWTLLVRGPYDKEAKGTWEYSLDDEDENVWIEAAQFIADSIRSVTHNNQFELYLNTPNALTAIMMDRISAFRNGAFTVYNFQRGNPPKNKRYKAVYSKP